MVSLNKSFIYGICFASFTWTISIYLFYQISQKENNAPPFTNLPVLTKDIVSHKIHSNNVIEHDSKDVVGKTQFEKQVFKNYVNSERIIKKLQPVMKKVNGYGNVEQVLNELGMVKTVEDQHLRDTGYKVHAFNVLISNQLSLHRDIPDTRNMLCKDVIYPTNLPTASIIICFYNEHYHTLLRSLHSILDRTPSSLLHEIILVNDYSDLKDLHSQVEEYIKNNLEATKVKIYKTTKREGLIRARMFGADRATGNVLIFLDSHIEVNQDWIQPLLGRIKENKTTVVMPVIDVINSDTFSYSSSPLVRGGFNWGLHFKWENLPKGTLAEKKDFIKPIKSPTMAGGLFAIDRKYFIDLGEYDAGMNIWGGENLEISFRIWMCGGSLELLPCSRVGHVFRQRRPYGSPDGKDTMLHNSLRVAYVWMDDYKEYFLKHRKEAANMDYGDITSRLQLRKELKCHDFQWYLKNIYPELTLPTDNEERLKKKWSALEQDKYQPWHSRKRNYVGQYQIRLSNSSLCIQSSKDFKSKGSALEIRSCLRSKVQMWFETDKSELVLAQLLCLQADPTGPHIYKCHEMGGDQEWKHKGENNSPVYNMAAGTCLTVKEKQSGATVTMSLCTEYNLNTWDLVQV